MTNSDGDNGSMSSKDEVLCITCCEPILKSAKKCKHCGAFQDWRRHINFSSTILSLLIALISVTSVAVNSYFTLTSEERSNISVELNQLRYGDNGDSVSRNYEMVAEFVIYNSGETAGIIDKYEIQVLQDNEIVASASNELSRIVEPQTYALSRTAFRLENTRSDVFPRNSDDYEELGLLKPSGSSFLGQETTYLAERSIEVSGVKLLIYIKQNFEDLIIQEIELDNLELAQFAGYGTMSWSYLQVLDSN